MGRALQALISEKAILHNLNVVKHLAPNSKVMAMIKANAYGHDMSAVARVLTSYEPKADALGVACIEEAISLRRSGVTTRIVLMEGFFDEKELAPIQEFGLEPVIHSKNQIQALLNSKLNISIWLKLNTGMNRLGFDHEEAKSSYSLLLNSNLKISGIMTHFASADEIDNNFTKEQINKFNNFYDSCIKNNLNLDVENLSFGAENPTSKNNAEKCLANSAAILKWHESHADWVRPGLMLYGISPFANILGKDLGLIPAMTLQTEIIAINKIKKGDGIGYNHTELATKDMKIGIIAVGYADGIGIKFTRDANVIVNGKKTNYIGRVAMDMATIDLTDISNPQVGDKVILWGEDLPVEEVASAVKTIPYELITGLGSRVYRIVM